ncbi:hypothetical protein [Longimicrobium terrae]|uniref:hypothetical protein n=1 Tax=Longimicrobium terrae TaxID=1639882 RepID=UPI0017ACB147|nr:hypothetical protein [Longimicrobium terrae]MBB4638696.1 hypothetical protein [Longimicrobium terrae]
MTIIIAPALWQADGWATVSSTGSTPPDPRNRRSVDPSIRRSLDPLNGSDDLPNGANRRRTNGICPSTELPID